MNKETYHTQSARGSLILDGTKINKKLLINPSICLLEQESDLIN